MRRLLIAAIDRYRARVAPHCTVCQSTPDQSFSYRVRQRVVEQGVLAGLLMLFVGWLAHLSGAGWAGPQRMQRGGW
jgi:hypothetical protein